MKYLLAVFLMLFSLSSYAELATGSGAQGSGAAAGRGPGGTAPTRELSRAETCRSFAQENPDLSDQLNLEGGSAPALSLRERAKKCISGVTEAWADTVKALILDPAKRLFVTSPAETKRYLEACRASMECKRGLFYEAYGREPSASDLQRLQSLGFAEMDVLNRNAMSRMNSSGMQNQRLADEMRNRQWLESDRGTPVEDGERGSFWSLVRDKIQSERTKWSCLTPEAAQELACYYIAQVVDPAIAAGMLTKAPKLAKLVRASGDGAGGSRGARATAAVADDTPAATRAARLARNGTLSNAERIAEAERVLGRPLTPGQRRALIDAHNVGSARAGAGIGNYTRAELNEKARLLREAGFTPDQRRVLMEEGLAGSHRGYLTGSVEMERPPVVSGTNVGEARARLGSTSPEYALMKPTDASQFAAAREYYETQGNMMVARGGSSDGPREAFLRSGNTDKYIETFHSRTGAHTPAQVSAMRAEVTRLRHAQRQLRMDQSRSLREAAEANRGVRAEYPRAEAMYSEEYMLHMERSYERAIKALEEELIYY